MTHTVADIEACMAGTCKTVADSYGFFKNNAKEQVMKQNNFWLVLHPILFTAVFLGLALNMLSLTYNCCYCGIEYLDMWNALCVSNAILVKGFPPPF